MDTLTELTKLFVSLTASKAAAVVLFLLFMIILAVAYEIHTSQLQIEKLSRVAALLDEIEPLTKSENEAVKSLADRLVSKASELLSERDSYLQLPIDQQLMLALLLGAPWVLLSLVGIGEAFQGESDWYYGSIGSLFIAALFGLIGYIVPIDIHWFYRYVAFPVLLTGGTFFFFWMFGHDDTESDA